MWIEDMTKHLNRKDAQITFDSHVFDRRNYRNLDLDKIEETVRTGGIVDDKCEQPNKACFRKYFGKENTTYVVIVRYHKTFIEVKTAWPKKGR